MFFSPDKYYFVLRSEDKQGGHTYPVMTGTSWGLNPIEHKSPEVYVSGGTEPSKDLYMVKQCQDHKM